MHLSQSALFFLLSITSSFHVAAAAAADPKPSEKPCTIHSPTTGSFYDLRPLQLLLSPPGTKPQLATNESYHAKGYDYPANFTINFCGPVVENLTDVEGVSKSRWQNVSAYYKDSHGETYSMGQQNDELLFRGKKLLLNYTMGSPCPELDEDGQPKDSKQRRGIIGGDDDDDKPKHNTPVKPGTRRKTTLFSFICDTSPLATTHPSISFLGTSDHCTYIFEVRSRSACAGITPSGDKGTLGPGGVFAVILSIALLVYLIGGVVYQRNVMHQRGWKQLPNYSVWAGLFGFFSDMFIIFFSTCTQHMPGLNSMFGGRRGYHRVGTGENQYARSNGSTGGVGQGRSNDDENRLIDSYDEEWDS